VTLTVCSDLSAADWIEHNDLPWSQLVGFGPAGFDAYARLRILPDPARSDQSESDVEVEDWRQGQLPRLFEVLATYTTTPDDCYFCVWDGYGNTAVSSQDDAIYIDDEDAVAQLGQPDAQPAMAPRSTSSTETVNLPKVVVPHRAYWLLRGPLADVGAWESARGWPSRFRLDEAEPAFVWPADRAWCVANDVDPHWVGVGGGHEPISQLTSDRQLDVILADPTKDQPSYH
jgi:hypothetical protein